ncbi:D-arabinitol dehydrogenase [Gaeumannomyces tritici R3-111a-1]|uniref:D-arabinitol dehydrogenase n=1 Tax=Gaeumannomyces tritici (strain R3-111a-1) TaxID=644352 RepID=J3PE60_GAET3|nr:D-arabinitol dehydrogenase [Gaeumannomyces tritici R3-111a-1]EJT70760.1 D-arabinitol dehydrogenase [Gaeumannomyces tritici R3-111a-1]
MLGSKFARAGSRLRAGPSSLFVSRRLTAPSPVLIKQRATAAFTTTTGGNRQPDPKDKEHAETAGSFARTDASVQVEYPQDHELPSSAPVTGAGRAGINVRPTLASFSLQGKVGIVTGGARGLGLVMGQGMVISGADLAIVDLNKEEAQSQAEAIVERFRKENPEAGRLPKVTAHYADVSSEESVAGCIAEVVAEHGKIDSLVTSAGFVENFEAVQYPVDRMRKLFGVCFDGTYLFATAVARHLMERQAAGSMVFIGSMSGAIVNVPQPQAPYNSAKAAVRHLAASLAVEWAHAGIRVNCISPGYMMTPLTKKILEDKPDLKKQWTSLIPQGRMGDPEDLMGPVSFLLSDASMYVTGADIRVDGGYTTT